MNILQERKKSFYLARQYQQILATVGIYAVLSVMPAYGYDGATLSKIEIIPAVNNSYQVIVKTDKDVPVEKHVTADNKIVLDLNNTRAAEFVNTIYNNTSKIDHVIVQPVSDDHLRIFVQGANISSSKVILDARKDSLDALNSNIPEQNITPPANATDNSANMNQSKISQPVINTPLSQNKTEIQKQEPETIVLSKPLDSFKPAAVYNNSENTAKTPTESVQESMLSGFSFKNIFNTHNFDWLLRFLAVILIIAGIAKLLFKPKKKVKIDLTSDLRDKDFELLKATLNKRQDVIGLGPRDYSKSKSNISTKPGYNSISKYGLKEYQNSQQPPTNNFSKMPKIEKDNKFIRPSINANAKERNESLLNQKPRKTSNINANVPERKVTNKDISNAKVNIDSMKFLENMAQIYEKSGRRDLAQGIQNNILKNNNGTTK